MKRIKMSRLALCSLCLLGLASSAEAHNGAVAIAVPVEGIKIDGDLSDWPARMRRYPIALVEFGSQPKDQQDYQGSFRIGYNAQENALYLAVEVEDESVVLDSSGGTWDSQDGGEVYVDLAHLERNSPIAVYYLWGERRSVGMSGILKDLVVQRRQQGDALHCEWRIATHTSPLSPGQVIGLDVVVTDRDADGSFTWMSWGRGASKFASSERLGDVLLGREGEDLGKLSGRVEWEDTHEGVSHAPVRIQSLDRASLWVQAETDQAGR